jgi:type II secretory pathway pseudopilin PulG
LSDRRGLSGFTVIEVTLALGIASIAALLVAPLVKSPAKIAAVERQQDAEAALGRAADTLVNDLREAAPNTIAWGALPATGTPFTFKKVGYNAADPLSPNTTAYLYTVNPTPGQSTGELVQQMGTAQTTLLRGLQMPAADWPLVQQDTDSYHVVVLRLAMPPKDGKTPRVLRRFAVRG